MPQLRTAPKFNTVFHAKIFPPNMFRKLFQIKFAIPFDQNNIACTRRGKVQI